MKSLWRRLPLLLIVFVFALSLTVGMVAAQDAPPAEAPSFDPSAALTEYLDALEATTSDIRGLSLGQEIFRLFPTPEEVAIFIRETYDEELDDETVFLETQFYRAFDFFDDDVDLKASFIDLLDDGVAGFYEPETREMNVLLLSGEEPGDELPFLEATTYVHEFVHALQDANFDLAALLESIGDAEADRGLAVLALIEGDASLTMQDYMFEALMDDPGAALELLTNPVILQAQASMVNIPDILNNELTFPYLTGLEFVTALRNEGGYAAIDAAFANLPVSTEQIIHPEKYLAGELPIDVVLNEVADLLDAEWSMLYERTLGEFYLRQYLGTQVSNRVAGIAAAGWGGDRYQLYYRESDNALAFVLRVVFDSPDDADEFIEGYERFAGSRTQAQPEVVERASCWSGADAVLCMLRNNDDTVNIVRVPADSGADFALELLAMQGM